MDYGKYIIKEVQGHEVAILFSHLIQHCDIGTRGDSRGKDIAAGFFSVAADKEGNVTVGCWGKSETMKLKSRKEEDELLVKRVVRPEY
jgi:hypothetical protein